MKGYTPYQDHHESAEGHVTGGAYFVNDLGFHGMLHGALVVSAKAAAVIRSIDIEAALKTEGVKALLLAKDVPGDNRIGAVVHDEYCLAGPEVSYIGQVIGIVAATDPHTARKAARKVVVIYEEKEAVLNITEAIARGDFLGEERIISCGDVDKVLRTNGNTIEGELSTGAQEHWYLETQTAVCQWIENHMKVYSSTQHPSETQALVARVLGLPENLVDVEVTRLGGAFGGKETQAAHVACWAALLAKHTGKPVKIHLTRKEDMVITGKRHPYLCRYRAAFNDDGKLTAVDLALFSDGGAALDLSMAIMERAMFHTDNAYFIPNFRVKGRVCRTNHPPNTAFRGFGAPQGMAVMETIIDRIARKVSRDAADIRKLNFYGLNESNVTPYGEVVGNNRLHILWERLMESSSYRSRRMAVKDFNATHHHFRRGLAISPVKFGISFTTTFLNQAGALVNLYDDGTLLVNHGGVEMGQGLHTKIIGIAAEEMGLSPERIRVSATDTSKVPNTSATAASSGTDLNGMAVKDAIVKLKERLAGVALKILKEKEIDVNPEDLVFSDNMVYTEKHRDAAISFAQLASTAYRSQVSLSATGYYKTPDIHFDKDAGKGRPFHYYAFGMAVSEVEIDLLTGHCLLIRTDILHDAGKSINKAIDLGQIRGGFIQGLGWCTTEEVVWDKKGRLLTDSPDTYKIPTIGDIPGDFRAEVLDNVPNPNTIRQSKAVGEPPFMLALSVWLAIRDAVSSEGDHRFDPELNIPATAEYVLQALQAIYQKKGI